LYSDTEGKKKSHHNARHFAATGSAKNFLNGRNPNVSQDGAKNIDEFDDGH
jgi:hypothetical protein